MQGLGPSGDAAHRLLRRGKLGEGHQGLAAAPHPTLLYQVLPCSLGFFLSLACPCSYFWVVFSVLFLTERKFIEP